MSTKYLRQRRTFSPALRKQIVRLIESGKLSASAASREYMVSLTTIYRWIYRYSTYNKKGNVLVVDKDSQTEKLKQLQKRSDQLEQAVDHKQMQINYFEKFIELFKNVNLIQASTPSTFHFSLLTFAFSLLPFHYSLLPFHNSLF